MKFTVEETKEESKIGGSALGPDWHRSLGLSGGAEVKCDQIWDKCDQICDKCDQIWDIL